MSDSHPHVLKRWFEEVWNKAREEAIDEMAAAEVVSHGLVDARGQGIVGRDKFKEFWRHFRGVFPDVHVHVDDALADGDKEIVRCSVRATHRGDGLGVAPTQKPIQFSGMVIARIQDGKMVEVWDSWDFLSLYQQLGMVKAPLV